MPATGYAFIIALLLAISVPASGVTASGKPDTSPHEEQQDLQQPLEGTSPAPDECQLGCKNRYLREIKKCRQFPPTTFKRHQCIKKTNVYGLTCKNFCKSKHEDGPPLE